MEDLTPLADRVRVLLALRLVLVAIVLGSGSLASVRTQPLRTLVVITGIYLLGAALTETARRLLGGSGALLAIGVLLDGAYLVAAAWACGGLESPLLVTLDLETVGVTLLASYRSGLKLAFWNCLLLDGIYQLDVGPAPSPHSSPLRDLVVAILSLFGLTLGAAVFSAVNERELRRRRVDLQALVTLSGSLDHAGGPESMATVLAQQGADNFNATRVAVLTNGDGNYELLAAFGGTGDPVGPLAPGAAVAAAWDTADAVLLKGVDPTSDPDLAAIFPDGRHLVVLPMAAEGRPVGALILELGHAVRGRVERRLVDTARQFAAQAALAIENARLLREVGRLAATDSLTGLANRRSLATELDRALTRARRTGRPVSVVLVDVDHFKSVNDRFGHRTGDELLRSVANVLTSCTGAAATTARYGGEEFALLLPDMTAEAACRIAEVLRRAVPRGTDPAVTVSAGVSTMVPDDGLAPGAQGALVAGRSAVGSPGTDLLAEADRALYAAKRGGRDRVVHVDHLPEDVRVLLAPV